MQTENNGGYKSSEELRRKNHDAFLDENAKKEAEEKRTEKDKLHRVLDKYIAKHSRTTSVREMAKENNRDASYQLDLSADVVQILEKIKKQLR